MIVNHIPDLLEAKFSGEVNITRVQEETGLNYGTVSRWLKRRVDRADFPVLEAWCKYLNVQVGDILEYAPDQA